MSNTELQRLLEEFAKERDWEQFHNPKNLAMALAGEVGELVELFQWLSAEEAAEIMAEPRRAQAVREEVADVFSYLLRLADVTGVDLEEALRQKVALNRIRYPAELAKGNASKYTRLREQSEGGAAAEGG
ncbi:nucleotide pyrophosphohydrolase [Streptomyces xiaopingdaonensis]|uniref:nucleotide pyrophosphohydrolase n=1 Tax=Streptomyces xiaopingdaonensis TaxID=1565415 RepID=UPI0002DB89EE|nr:nucleotide pyrophosphohydrolase [Streptomyces xiaopingdaonensis]